MGARSRLRSLGQETRADPTHLRLHVQLRATRVREAQWKRTGCLGSRDPRSLARSRRRARALQDPAATNSAPHPPLLNSNGCHHTHLARHAGTNRRRRHNWGPIAAPSASRGHTRRPGAFPSQLRRRAGDKRVSHVSGLTFPLKPGHAGLPLDSSRCPQPQKTSAKAHERNCCCGRDAGGK